MPLGIPTRPSSSAARLRRLLPVHTHMQHQRLLELLPDGKHRVQRCHGVLENDADLRASHEADLLVRHLEQILPDEGGLSADDLSRRRGDEAQQRHHRDALAATALAHNPQRLALFQAKGNPVYCVNNSLLSFKLRFQPLDVK